MRGRLDHLDHERRAAARQIVGGADAGEQAVDDADACAERAGTNEPICASTAISAFWRRNVDLPAMLGPVTSQMRAVGHLVEARSAARRAPRPSTQSFSMKAPALARAQRLLDDRMAAAADLEGRAVVEHGADVALARAPARRGPPSQSSSASAAATRAERRAPRRATAAASSAKTSCSMASARSAAEAMRPSISISSAVVKRMALAIVWRWRNVVGQRRAQQRLGVAPASPR